jgi:hypothetical protein
VDAVEGAQVHLFSKRDEYSRCACDDTISPPTHRPHAQFGCPSARVGASTAVALHVNI